jgi:hypothetical protein
MRSSDILMTGVTSSDEAEDLIRANEEFRDACEELVRLMARDFAYEKRVPTWGITQIHYSKAHRLVQGIKSARE